MQILKNDFCVVVESGERLKDIFSECAEKKFVFPFLPFFDENIDNFFSTSFFISKCFGQRTSNFIQGFEVEVIMEENIKEIDGKLIDENIKEKEKDKGKEKNDTREEEKEKVIKGESSTEGKQKYNKYKYIKQGGRTRKTNTGLNLIPLFFGYKKREIISEIEGTKLSNLLKIPKFNLKKVYVKILTSGFLEIVKVTENSSEKINEILENLKSYDVIFVKRKKSKSAEKFEILSFKTLQNTYKITGELIKLPESYQKIYDFIPFGKFDEIRRISIFKQGEIKDETTKSIVSKINESNSENFIITSDINYLSLIEL